MPYALLAMARRAVAAPAGPDGEEAATPWSSTLLRWGQTILSPTHLMLFYLFGRYYYASHRVVGVRYVRGPL